MGEDFPKPSPIEFYQSTMDLKVVPEVREWPWASARLPVACLTLNNPSYHLLCSQIIADLSGVMEEMENSDARLIPKDQLTLLVNLLDPSIGVEQVTLHR